MNPYTAHREGLITREERDEKLNRAEWEYLLRKLTCIITVPVSIIKDWDVSNDK